MAVLYKVGRTLAETSWLAEDGINSEDCRIISIDFGTTYSGVAYTTLSKPDRIEVVSDWKTMRKNENRDRSKVPTAIHIGKDGRCSWGYSLTTKLDLEAFRWFKLLLMDDNGLPAGIRDSTILEAARGRLKADNRKAVDVVAAYLKELWKHCVDSLSRSYDAKLNDSRTHVQVVMTVPAIWNASAQDAMREAARHANIVGKDNPKVQLDFVTEPEAAAIATLKDYHRNELRKNDSITVVDCGGGTVDLTTYVVAKGLPLAIEQCGESDGDFCGAKFVDQEFENLLDKKLDAAGVNTKNNSFEKMRTRLINKHWEDGIKKHYGADDIKEPEVMDIDTHSDMEIELSVDEIESVFRKSFARITEMVQKQVQTVRRKGFGGSIVSGGPKYVILVGGFGRCAFLYQTLSEKLREISPTTELLQSRTTSAWTAVCRGAVMHGIGLQSEQAGRRAQIAHIKSRVINRNYGITFKEEYDHRRHNTKDGVYKDETTGIWMAKDQMHWFFKRGQSIETTKPVRHKFIALYPCDEPPPETVPHVIYASDAYPGQRLPRRLTSDVKKLCTLTWLCDIDFAEVEKFRSSDGKGFYKLEFGYSLALTGADVTIQVYLAGEAIECERADEPSERAEELIEEPASTTSDATSEMFLQ